MPNWFVWQGVLDFLDKDRLDNGGRIRRLSLSAADASLVTRETIAFRTATTEYESRSRASYNAMTARHASLRKIVDEQQKIVVAYRHLILDARDRLQQELSEQGRQTIADYADEIRANSQVTGTKIDLPRFYEPRR